MGQFFIDLPLPPSVNAMHAFGKRGKVVARSAEYKKWLQYAGISWRKQYPYHPAPLTGRLRAQYIFTFADNSRERDICNREKCLSDFLQQKLFENDSQIDEAHFIRRIKEGVQPKVECWITEIPDSRFIDMLSGDAP